MKKKQKISKIIILSLIIIALALSLFFANSITNFIYSFASSSFNIVSSKGNLLVHFINVGQGDATAINFPNGEVMLIDSGPISKNNEYVSYIKENIMNNKIGRDIDYLILTHAEADHFGGVALLLENFNVKTIYMPTIDNDKESYIALKNYITDNCNYKIITEKIIINNGAVVTMLPPVCTNDRNNSCPIVKVEYKDTSFIFAGDCEETAEKLWVQNYGDFLDADVYKVSHHGSNTSNKISFLNAITPDYAVISTSGQYGHPHQDTINNLNSLSANIYITKEVGNVLFVVGKNYDTLVKTGDKYIITALSLDYVYIVVIVDGLLSIILFAIILKKTNN